MAEQTRHRKPRSSEKDPNYRRSKATISSILISSSSSSSTETTTPKKKSFPSATFRGLGCASSSQVSVPAVIRKSANWEAKKLKKRRPKIKKGSNDELLIPNNSAMIGDNPPTQSLLASALSSGCVGGPDAWCRPGMGLSTDAASVVSRRPGRGKVDELDRIAVGHRERSCTMRRMATPEDNSFLKSDTAIGTQHIRSDVLASRHHGLVRHGFREGHAEIVMLQRSLLMGGRSDAFDRHRDLRLDVDNMSYEELLELGDRIGYVSTGLGEDEITRCLRRAKLVTMDGLSSDVERRCSICQDEYEPNDEMGKLNCGHLYHMDCIKLWLGQKNACPICKTPARSVKRRPEAK